MVGEYNVLDTQYNQYKSENPLKEENSGEHTSQLHQMIVKLREIIDKVNTWTGSLGTKSSKINTSLSKTGIAGFFTRTRYLTSKLAKKTAKSQSLGNWLSNTVQPEMNRVSSLMSNAYSSQMNTDDKENMFIGNYSPLIHDDPNLTKAQGAAIRTYTTSMHFFMNDVMQLPKKIAKARIKSRLKHYMSFYVLDKRKGFLEGAKVVLERSTGVREENENETVKLQREKREKQLNNLNTDLTKLEQLITSHKNNVPEEITKTTLDLVFYFENEIQGLIKSGEGGKAFLTLFNNFISRASSDTIVDRFYNEVAMQNTMVKEGLHSLPGYYGKVYRGDWEGSIPITYKGSKIKFSFFGSTSKDIKVAMGFTSFYRGKTQNMTNQEQGKYAAWYKTPVLLEIQLIGRAGKDITDLSTASHEKEVLIMPGTECKILSRQTRKFKGSNQQYILVKAIELPNSLYQEVDLTTTTTSSSSPQTQETSPQTQETLVPLTIPKQGSMSDGHKAFEQMTLGMDTVTDKEPSTKKQPSHHGSISHHSVLDTDETEQNTGMKFTGMKFSDDGQKDYEPSMESQIGLDDYGLFKGISNEFSIESEVGGVDGYGGYHDSKKDKTEYSTSSTVGFDDDVEY